MRTPTPSIMPRAIFFRFLSVLAACSALCAPDSAGQSSQQTQALDNFMTMQKALSEGQRKANAEAEAGAARGNAKDQYTYGERLLDEKQADAGVRLLRKSAAQNYLPAAERLGLMYLLGTDGAPVDVPLACEYLWKATALGSGQCRDQLFSAFLAAGDEASVRKVVSAFVQVSSDADINLYLGSWYLRFVAGGDEEGVRRLKACLQQGDTRAYRPLIEYYLHASTKAEVEEGWRLANEADAKGVNDVRRELANVHLLPNSQGQPRDRTEAIRLLEAAANSGDEEAVYTLINLYDDRGFEDPKRRLYWAEFGAQRNMPLILHELGALYIRGDAGLTKDRNKAIQLWTEAARAGSMAAAGDLAALYKYTIVDPAKERHWREIYEELTELSHAKYRREL